MIRQNYLQSGFTLVEVLVAITILLLASIGPINIITQSNNSSAFAAEQTQAFFFAQEGIELAQKVRDELVLDYFDDEFNNGGALGLTPFTTLTSGGAYAPCFDTSRGCGLTINNGSDGGVTVTNCTPTGVGCRLYVNANASDRSRFIHSGSGGNETLFTRVITMVPVGGTAGNPDSIAVTSTVTWRTGTLIASQEVVTSSYLFNIYETN